MPFTSQAKVAIAPAEPAHVAGDDECGFALLALAGAQGEIDVGQDDALAEAIDHLVAQNEVLERIALAAVAVDGEECAERCPWW